MSLGLEMAINAAGLDVSGKNNPRWKGGLIFKSCEICKTEYSVKLVNNKSRFCSLSCVGKYQKNRSKISPEKLKRTEKSCEVCGATYSVPTAHEKRHYCCSRECSYKRRSQNTKGEQNPSWSGGLSRFPYPWNFREISNNVIKRDGFKCQNPYCSGNDLRMTAHHINYDKQDCRLENLICVCSSCNSKANFGRHVWMDFYQSIMASRAKKDGGGWQVEEF